MRGARGIEDVWEIRLTDEEMAALKKSTDSLKDLVAVVGV